MNTPFHQILEQKILTDVQKLLVDHRIGNVADDGSFVSGYDDTAYQDSQFKHIYGDTAYRADNRRSPNRVIGQPDPADGFVYPLTQTEMEELQELRVLCFCQLGFVPIEDMDVSDEPSLYIANATDRQRIEAPNTTLNQVEEVIPINFRLVTKQPEIYTLEKTNIIVIDRVVEGLKYVLNPDDYQNLSFQRRGYDQPTVIRKIEFAEALNLEDFLTPYEVCDILFRITVREQYLR